MDSTVSIATESISDLSQSESESKNQWLHSIYIDSPSEIESQGQSTPDKLIVGLPESTFGPRSENEEDGIYAPLSMVHYDEGEQEADSMEDEIGLTALCNGKFKVEIKSSKFRSWL